MENRTEINIEDKIAVWKSALLTNPTLTEDNADELESHLLDEMASLQELGLTDNESFMIAENRMGSLANLTKEFGKVNKNVLLRTKILPYLL